jgi:PAS domain S-box-containing protein
MSDEDKAKEELIKELIQLRKSEIECKKIEEKLRQDVNEWEEIFNSVADFIFIQDKDYRLIKVNAAVCAAFSVKREDIMGKRCFEVLHRSDQPWPNCPMCKTLHDGKPHTEEIFDPNIGVPLLVSIAPLFNEKGEMTGAVHIAKDISKQKKAEEELRKMHEKSEGDVKERTKELQEKITELERFRKATIDREFRMRELQEEIEKLKGKK